MPLILSVSETTREERKTMDGKPEKRKSDTIIAHEYSQEKYPKLSANGTSSSSEEKQYGAVVHSQASNEIFNLSDQEHSAKLEGKGNEASELHPEENTAAKWRIRDGGESLPSSSQGTIILSEGGDGEEESSANHNSTTLDLETSSHTLSPSPRELWKETSLVKDADVITGIFPDAASAVVFDTLAKHRANPDRLNIATVTILDSSSSLFGATEHVKKHAGSSPNHAHDASQHVTIDENAVQGTSHDDNSLYDDVKKVIIRIKAVKPDVEVNATEVYLLLEQHRGQADRIGLVCNALLGNSDPNDQHTEAFSANNIFTQAMKLTSEFPNMNPSTIYELLEKAGSQENTLQSVREKLQAQPKSSTQTSMSNLTSTPKVPVPKDDSISNDPLVRNDPVFRDMRIISKMFPEKDQNEIYALVEAHYYKKDRVQVVIEELLRVERNSQDSNTLSHSFELETSVLGDYGTFFLLITYTLSLIHI